MSDIITADGNGHFRVSGARGQRTAYASRDGSRTWVFLDGEVHVIDDRARTGTPAALDDRSALSSPMPATVTEVRVREGDRVEAGDVLITLEAMKMELPIRAPRPGRVRRVGCRAGELVQPGAPLVDLE